MEAPVWARTLFSAIWPTWRPRPQLNKPEVKLIVQDQQVQLEILRSKLLSGGTLDEEQVDQLLSRLALENWLPPEELELHQRRVDVAGLEDPERG